MNDPQIDALPVQQVLFDSSELADEQQSSAPMTAPKIRIEMHPNSDARVGRISLRQRLRRAIACRELKRVVRDAPTANDTQRSVDDRRAERAHGPLTALSGARR
jgi:hypothetical protein